MSSEERERQPAPERPDSPGAKKKSSKDRIKVRRKQENQQLGKKLTTMRSSIERRKF
jgi:hypothetical protein